MLNFECSNPVWGVTTNPWKKEYTCGGSSGGEGAILAADGTALGIGSDVGEAYGFLHFIAERTP